MDFWNCASASTYFSDFIYLWGYLFKVIYTSCQQCSVLCSLLLFSVGSYQIDLGPEIVCMFVVPLLCAYILC